MNNNLPRTPIGIAEAMKAVNSSEELRTISVEPYAQQLDRSDLPGNSTLGFFLLGVNEEVRRLVYGITPKGIFYGQWWVSPSLNSATRVIHIDSPSWKVFNYLAATGNLKEWAVSGIIGPVPDLNDWLDVNTLAGPAMLNLRIDPMFAVADFKVIRSNKTWYFATRVLTNNDQSCELVVTIFTPTPFGSKLFDSTAAFIDQKLAILKGLLEGRA